MEIIIAIAIVVVVGVKPIYALIADRARLLIQANFARRLNLLSGAVMIGVGLFLLFRS